MPLYIILIYDGSFCSDTFFLLLYLHAMPHDDYRRHYFTRGGPQSFNTFHHIGISG